VPRIAIFSAVRDHKAKRLARDLPSARSHHHATNAVYPAAPPHAVLPIMELGIDFSATEGFDTSDDEGQNEESLGET